MAEQAQAKFKRTQYFIHKRFQLRYVGLILILMLAAVLVSSYVIYYTSMVMLGERLAMVYPQGRLADILATVNIRVLLTMLCLVPVVVVIGIYLSHKIAGPADRMEKFLSVMASGDFRSPLVLRKGDELTKIADAINHLQESLKKTIAGQKDVLGKVIGELEAVKELTRTKPGDTAAVVDGINRLENELKALNHAFDKYKLPPLDTVGK